MGVPKFYRWLSERYPLINQQVTGTTRAECDHLYLDMNGIIHNSAHSDDASDDLRLRLTEQQIFTNVFKYLDKLFRLVRPRRLLYMALDGVAPRAKMNQQRQRRFRSAAEAATALSLARAKGEVLGDLQPFDSNQITPGTEFMKRLSDALKYFIRRKVKEDVAWQRIKVVLSGSEVPGEGEHKIMLFIRNMKMQRDYNPNLRHAIYGLDADLIFLSLVSHEPHFFLLREEVLFGGKGGGGGGGKDKLPRKVLKNLDEFQLLHISLLRDYLYLEYLPHAAHFHWPGGFDQERVIDDWVFLAYLCGNDFLPHLPTLDIGEGGLDTLFRLYKESLPELDGYITEYGTLHVRRLEVIFRKMGKLEEEVFQRRLEEKRDEERRERRGRRRAQEIAVDEDFADDDMKVLQPPTSASPDPNTILPAPITQDDTGATIKQRYYGDKFPQFYDAGLAASHPELFDTTPVPSTSDEHRRSLVTNYLEGLMWIQKYYYQGVPSWKWYFRYRYAPLASDMVNLASLSVSFNLGQPFRPLEQLLGVLPPASRNFLPPVYRDLMVGDSSIVDFYPLQFNVDMNGKRSAWEGIALIPFIEERRLLGAVSKLDSTRLSTLEKLRNVRVGDEYIYEYDANNKDTYPPPLPGFVPIKECQSKVSVWTLPLIPLSTRSIEQAASFAAVAAVSQITTTTARPSSTSAPLVDLHVKPLAEYEAQEQAPAPQEGTFVPTVPEGCKRPHPGFPSLLALKAEPELRAIGIDVFGSASRKDTLVLSVQQGQQPADAQMQFASQLVGKRVWVEWPYLREAEVVSATDGRSRVTADSTMTLMPGLLDSHLRECRYLQQKQLGTRGVDTSDVTVLINVRAFNGMRRMDDGSIRKLFDIDLTVPAQLIAAHNPAPDDRWVEQPAPTLQSSFPVGSTVIYVGPNYYGALATITGHTSTVPGKQQVALSIVAPPPMPPFGQQIARTSRLQYYPSHLVAQSLELHPLVLGKVCSSVYVYPGYGDLGLKLRYSKQSMQVPEYARRVDSWQDPRQKRPQQHVSDKQGGGGGNNYDSVGDSAGSWEYSEKAVALVAAYKKRFPYFFDMLQSNPHEYKYSATSLSKSGSAKEGDAVLKEITEWLTTVGTNNLVLVPCTSQMMADRGVKAVEAESARLHQLYTAQPRQAVLLDNVSLLHLYPPTPALAWSPTESEAVELGDRVLSLRSDVSVPLGLRGTVVGVHAKSVEVVWDEEFMTGNSLNGRCHHLRGQTLPLTAFVNLSKPRILQLSKKQDTQAAKQQARTALSALGGKKAAAAAPPAKPAAGKVVAAPAAPEESKIASRLEGQPTPAAAAAPAAAKAWATAPAKAKPAQSKASPKPAAAPAQPKQPQPAPVEEKTAVSESAGDELVTMWNKLQAEVQSNNTAPQQQSHTASTATAVRPVSFVVQPSAAAASSAPDEVEQASALLKQLLHVGSASSAGLATHAAAPAAAAASDSTSAEDETDDRLANKIAKSKARKAAAASLPSAATVAAAYASPMPATTVQPHYLHQQFNTFSQPTAGPAFPPAQAAPMYYPAPSHFPTQPQVPIASYPQQPPAAAYPPYGAAPPSQQQPGRGRGAAPGAHRGGAGSHNGRGGQWQPKPAAATEGSGA